MTIKEFAKLCGCNPQTLRYYDKENLLKPISVDKYSGYRYYNEEQAISFAKIKNLQKAGFAIEEIKWLINCSDAEIYLAFEARIVEEEMRIQEIREIQKAYQSDVLDMMNKIEMLKDLLKESIYSYDPLEEFGIDHSTYVEMVGNIDSLFDGIVKDGDLSRFEYNDYLQEDDGAEVLYLEGCLNNPDYEIIFEDHGWEYVRDFYSRLPKMSSSFGYLLLFRVKADKPNKTAFANTAIGMCMAEANYSLRVGCTVIDSEDGQNHFWLVRYKDQDL